jgi:hypothetical protein
MDCVQSKHASSAPERRIDHERERMFQLRHESLLRQKAALAARQNLEMAHILVSRMEIVSKFTAAGEEKRDCGSISVPMLIRFGYGHGRGVSNNGRRVLQINGRYLNDGR